MIAVSSENPDFSTNANNQQYEIKFTTNHAVYRNGYIKLIIQLIKIGYNHETGKFYILLDYGFKKNSARFQLEN